MAPLTLTRDDAASLTLVGVPNNPNNAFASAVPGRGYTVQYAGAVPLRPRVSLSRTVEGEWVRLTLPYPQASLRVIRDFNGSQPLTAAADLAELEASSGDRYWFDTGTGLLHLKLVTRSGRTSATVQVEPDLIRRRAPGAAQCAPAVPRSASNRSANSRPSSTRLSRDSSSSM